MTTVQLAQRLLRYLTVKDLALLSGDDALHLLDAINSGIQQFYALAPSIYKQTSMSGILRAAQDVTLDVTLGSPIFTGYTASYYSKGYTIRIEGDDNDNEIVASNGLLDSYMGETGTRQATIWGDCLQLNTVIDRLTSEPKLDTGDVLWKDDEYKQWGGFCYPEGWGFRRGLRNRKVGRPRRYWIEAVGQSQAGDPAFLLRVDTLPDQDYRVRLDGELAPRKVTFIDLTTPVVLPIDDALVESNVLPICASELTESPLWQNSDNKKDVNERASKALQLIGLLSPIISVPNYQVGTPKGY
jgi:hypothetical protein